MDTLLLIDGMAVMYRSFFAVKGLCRSDGTPINAAFGFIRLYEQMLRQWAPTHCVVVWDGGTPQRRLEICPEYKAQRPHMPDELRSQFSIVNQFLERRACAACRLEGEEADDVMATLAARGVGRFALRRIASGDKDMLQIVNDTCRLVNVSGKAEETGPDEVKARTGVAPVQIPDWLAMIGDSADNIRGVPGIGRKTATRLLAEYGSIEGLYAALDKLPQGRVREQLEQSHELLERNRGLVSLKTDLEIDADWESFAVTGPDAERLLPFFREWEFRAMQKELEAPELF